MRSEKSQNPRTRSAARVSDLLLLENEAAAGRFEGIECPKCRHASVSVSFTHPAADVYRTWFICSDCDFHTRAQHADRPPYFSESRINTESEERDLLIL